MFTQAQAFIYFLPTTLTGSLALIVKSKSLKINRVGFGLTKMNPLISQPDRRVQTDHPHAMRF